MLRYQRRPSPGSEAAVEPAPSARAAYGGNQARQASLQAAGALASAPMEGDALAAWMADEDGPGLEGGGAAAGEELAAGGPAGGPTGDPSLFGGIDAFGGMEDWIGVPGFGGLGGPGGGGLDLAAELAQATLWAQAGPYGPMDQIGPGGTGGFSALYNPNGGPGELIISQDVALDLQDSLVLEGGVVVPNPTLPSSPSFRALANNLNDLPAQERELALRDFQWDASERSDGGPWATQLEAVVEQTWGGKHEFFLNRPGWDFIGAQVAVDLDLHMRPKTDSDHMEVVSYKLPPDTSFRDFRDDAGERIPSVVNSGSGTNAHDQTMRLASNAIGPAEYDLLKRIVTFEAGSATLTTAGSAELRTFVDRFDGALDDPRHQATDIALVVYTDGDSELAERRAANVEAVLGGLGFHNAAARIRWEFRTVPEGEAAPDRAELVVDGGARSVVAAHEFGHAFGLDDEYGPGAVGTATEHDQWVKDMSDAGGNPLPGSIHEHNGGVMSYGNEVRPQHYATFHHALRTITKQDPWSLGAPKPYAFVAAQAVPPELANPVGGSPQAGVDGGDWGGIAEVPMTGGEWGGFGETPGGGGETGGGDFAWPEVDFG